MILPIAVFALLSLVSASDVLEFTDSDFGDEIGKHDIILVEFFAPWCGHCKRLAPEYEDAATRLLNNDPPVRLAKVDCTASADVCGKYGVSGYPTLKIFRGGELSEDYNGPREAGGIVKYMASKSGPASRELTDLEAAEKFLSHTEYGVVGFFNSESDELAKTFQKVATGLSDNMRFAHSYNADINKKYGYSDDIVLYQPKRLQNKFEKAEQKYDDDATVFKIKKWVQTESIGLCPVRTPDNGEEIDKNKPIIIAYFDVDYVKNVKGTNYWRNRVMKVAKKLKDAGKSVSFAISSKDTMSHEISEFGITSPSADAPTVAARDSKNQKYIMEDKFSMDSLEQFANDLLDGKLEPYLKSEAVPEQTEAVKVLVAKNFNDIVQDDKDVLLEFYAPWCGHCKSLEPKYKELAEKLADEPNLVIAKMDATANDVPSQYEVQGFPTIYFKPAGGQPKKYQGGREVADFTKYLAKECTNKLESVGKEGKKKKGKKTEL